MNSNKPKPKGDKKLKDKCYLIPAKDGLGFIKVRASKKPTGTTLVALQELFLAAYDKAKDLKEFKGLREIR